MHPTENPPPFDTAAYAAADRFAVWCAGMAGVFKGSLPERADPLSFHAAAECRLFGPASIISGELAAVRMQRTASRAARDGVEAYAVVLYETGGWVGDIPGGRVLARPQVPVLLDMSRQLSVAADAGRYLILNLSRQVLDLVVPADVVRHGVTLEGAAGALLREQLLSLDRHSTGLSARAAEAVAGSVARSIAACLPHPSATGTTGDPDLRRQAIRCIDRALQDPALSVETLCATLGVSRSKLYRAFQGADGISATIQGRRLDRIFRLLADPHQARSIRALRESHGFTEASHFSTAFHRRFGCSPSQSRDRAQRSGSAGTQGRPFDHHGWTLLNER